MVVEFTTTYVQSVSVTTMLLVRIPLRARCTTLRIKFVSDLKAGRWVSPGTPVSSTNKTDRNDITEILLKVALNTINP